MSLTKEQLLAPRYKVIADYPGSRESVGDIFTQRPEASNSWLCSGDDLVYGSLTVPRFQQYPHLFKRLEWWEERQPEELPEYVKFNRQDTGELKVVKVASWELRDVGDVAFKTSEGDWCLCNNQDTPATLEEYLSYQASLKQA